MRYGIALVSVGLAVLFRELLAPLFGEKMPFLLLYPAVLVSTWCGGLGPGLMATTLCAVAAAYFWLAPFHSLAIDALADQVGLVLAVLVMLLITWLTTALRRTQEQSAHQVRQVQARTVELTQANAALQDEIAARQRTETALRQAHDKLRAHIENSPLAVIEWDREFRVQLWSPQAEQLLGWTAEEARGKRLDELPFIFAEDRATVIEEMQYLLTRGPLGGVPQQVKTNRNCTKDGRVIHCQWYNSMLFDEAGQLRSLLSLAHDITARVEAEAILHRSQEELERLVQARTTELTQANAALQAEIAERQRAEEALRMSALVLDHMAEGVVMTDFDTYEIVFTNPAFDDLNGYAHGELLGQHVAILNAYTPEENSQLFQEVRNAAQATGAWTGEVANRKKDGTLFTSSVHAVLLKQAGKQYWVTVQQDVTMRKQLEESSRQLNAELEQRVQERTADLEHVNTALQTEIATRQRAEHHLRERIEELETLLDLLPISVWQSHDPAGAHITGNRAGYEMLRMPAGGNASLSAPLSERPMHYRMCRPDGVEIEPENLPMQYAATHGVTIPGVEFLYRFADGAEIYAYGTAKPLFDAQGQVRGSLGVFLDITTRKQAEETLAQHTRELERVNADLRQIAYIAAHDLQEPVRQVGLYSQKIAQRYQNSLDAVTSEAVGFIVEAARRMIAQLTDLMQYLTIDERPAEWSPTDCELVVQHVLEQLRPTIMASAATITHEPLPTITAQPAQLQLVFQELLDNAVKFYNSTPPRVHLWAEREAEGWRFAVRDHGIGIDPQYYGQLFSLFKRMDRNRFPGTGIGLALCKKIVERHGGGIWLEPTPGGGVTVIFTISDVKEGEKR